MSDTGRSAPSRLSGLVRRGPTELSDPGGAVPSPRTAHISRPNPSGTVRTPTTPALGVPTDPSVAGMPAGCRAGRQEAPSLAQRTRPDRRDRRDRRCRARLGRRAATPRSLGSASCFDEPSGTATEVEDRPSVCTEPHDGEEFFVGNHPVAGTRPPVGARCESWAVEKASASRHTSAATTRPTRNTTSVASSRSRTAGAQAIARSPATSSGSTTRS